MYGANRRERNGDRELRNCRKEGLQDARGKLQRRVERDGMGWQQLCKEFLGGGMCNTPRHRGKGAEWDETSRS